jgi:glycerate 2-kinase
MTNLPALHKAAREIFYESLKSVDAKMALRRAVRLEDSRLHINDTTLELANAHAGIYSVAIGKAARPMASALTEFLGERLTAGVITAPSLKEHSQTNALNLNLASPSLADNSLSDRWRVFAGGHPLPNLGSLNAARAAFDLLRRANLESAPVIFLISGGGSAMMEWPREANTTLDELQATNKVLVSCGASIIEINAVRRAISAVKGGGLARRAPNCDQISLIVSDTGAGHEATVASGPTFAPQADAPDAAAVVTRYNLEAVLPESVLRAIQQPFEETSPSSQDRLREHYVLLDNEHALASAAEAARSRGFIVEIKRGIIEQPIAEGCSILLSKLLDLHRRKNDKHSGVCLISGGEFACPVRGPGTGGRNAESALRWAIEMDALSKDSAGPSHVVAMSAGTDGIDGNSPAAGAIADETTLNRASLLNLDARRFLEESDAYTFFDRLGDAIITGPTGTNVRDVRIMLAR